VTINRKAFQTPPKIWHSVMWTRKGRGSYTDSRRGQTVVQRSCWRLQG
jgi:hypothetical protein